MKLQIDPPEHAADSRFDRLLESWAQLECPDSQGAFERVCREIILLWKRAFPHSLGRTDNFQLHLEHIREHAADTIETPWGGVDIAVRRDPHIEKFLAVIGGRHLAFEKHAEKEEHQFVREGAGAMLYGRKGERVLRLTALLPGMEMDFRPGDPHCLIAVEDILVYEVSEDHKGMDQDLIFIYTA